MNDPKYYVYMVHTQKDCYYTGVAIDPEKRVKEHNSGKRGAKSLRGQRPVTLVWKLAFPVPRSEALKIEKRIKKLPREQKLQIRNGAIDPRRISEPP
jgi:putative endonuclease